MGREGEKYSVIFSSRHTRHLPHVCAKHLDKLRRKVGIEDETDGRGRNRGQEGNISLRLEKKTVILDITEPHCRNSNGHCTSGNYFLSSSSVLC